ncbi:MAG TPA: ATP phosphoribosyltransferase [Ktedonobacteraceae bacterium]|nr:ATP phosphoribosyltransferase [Ktedonobacteraceae bacterium]
MSAEAVIRLAVPGKGTLEASTLTFLAECGMRVKRSNPRQYIAQIESIPDLEVVFLRAADIPLLVQDGDATLGITGYDILAEHRGTGDGTDDEGENFDTEHEELIVLERNLGFGRCRLVVAVPEDWIDVSTCADLWHLAGYYQAHKGRSLRVATKYPILTEQFLRRHGITRCKIVSPHGALEAAPLTKTVDFIVDLTETGTTLRENHLKLLDDGEVLQSQACLIANASLLRQNERALRLTSMMLELMEARVQARNRSLLTAYMQAESAEEKHRACARLYQRLKALVSSREFQVSSSEQVGEAKSQWYTISCVVNTGQSAAELLEVVAIFRGAGAVRIDTVPLNYRFAEESMNVRTLRERLKRTH